MGKVYQCNTQNSLSSLSREDLVIESATGTHTSLKTNDDVIAFQAFDKGLEFFPRGLDKVFKNLRAIYIHISKIQDFSQADLKPFPKLIFFEISNSEIRFIEDETFDFNPELEVIWLLNNNIFHFDTNVFRNLNKITWLGLTSNVCINSVVNGNLVEAKALIDSIKIKCFDSEFYEFKEDLKSLEIEKKSLKLENLRIWAEKFENLETQFKNSRFSHLNYFKDKFEGLRQKLPFLLILYLGQFEHNLKSFSTNSTEKSENFTNINEKLDKIDEKLTKFSANFDNFSEQIEEFKTIPVTVTRRLHKLELEQKEIRLKIQSLERKIDAKIIKVD